MLSDEDPGASLARVLEAARDDASEALAGTTSQLPALRAAGVVDAGGAGLVLLLDSFLQVVEGRPIEPSAGAGRIVNRDEQRPRRAERGTAGAEHRPGASAEATGDRRRHETTTPTCATR